MSHIFPMVVIIVMLYRVIFLLEMNFWNIGYMVHT